MDIILYQNEDSENTINKTLTNALTISVNFKADFDIEAPEIMLRRITGIDFSAFNYVHIPDVSRFYFIRSETKVNYDIVSLKCETDYLETFKTEILTVEGSYSKVLEAGDYGQLQLNRTGELIISEIESDTSLTPSNDKILTVLRWAL